METVRYWIEENRSKPIWKIPCIYYTASKDTPAMRDARLRHNRVIEQAVAARLARLAAAVARKQTCKQAAPVAIGGAQAGGGGGIGRGAQAGSCGCGSGGGSSPPR